MPHNAWGNISALILSNYFKYAGGHDRFGIRRNLSFFPIRKKIYRSNVCFFSAKRNVRLWGFKRLSTPDRHQACSLSRSAIAASVSAMAVNIYNSNTYKNKTMFHKKTCFLKFFKISRNLWPKNMTLRRWFFYEF